MDRVVDSARSPGWGFGPGPTGQIMATYDSGQIGLPWVVLADRAGRGLRISLYQPGDDIASEGEVIGEVAGNPREMGRQLRAILEDIERTPR